MYWTLELASSLDDAPWPATKDELIDYANRSGAPEEVIEIIKASGLRGRGGAGFPTGMKWGFARGYDADEKFVVCCFRYEGPAGIS